MHRPARLAPVLVLVMCGLLAACGDDADDDATVDPGAPPPTTVTTTPRQPPTSGAPTTSGDSDTPPTTVGRTDAEWTQVPVDGGPSARSSAVLVATPDGELWLHGGVADGTAFDDLWHFDGVAWEQVDAPGDAPAGRFEHVGVWDSARRRLVVALGQDDGGDVYDDVWAFGPTTGEWSRLSGGSGPAARYGSCAVVDDGRLVITHGFSNQQRFDDTWAFDLDADSWTDMTPATARPIRRCLHACAVDPRTGGLVLFGGRTDDNPYLGDTWRLDGDGWHEVTAPGPSPRARSRAATLDGSIHLIGGEGPDGLPADAWAFDGDGWAVTQDGAPAARQAHAIAQGDDEVWVFGGLDATGAVLGDLWRLG